MLRGRFPRFLIALALLASLAACGSDSPTGDTLGEGAAAMPKATVEGDLAALVPEGTHLLVYAPSVDDLVAKLKTIVSKFDPDAAEQVNTAALLEQMPIGPFVDTTRPMAVAVALPNGPGGPQPDMTVITAVTDVAKAEELAKTRGISALPNLGTFVAMHMGQEPATLPAKTATIVNDMAAGDVAVRIDLASLIPLHRAEADKALDEMDTALDQMPTGSMPGMADMMGTMKKSMKDFLDGAEALDVSLAIEGTTVHWKGLLTAKDGSELVKSMSAAGGGGGASLAAALPADWPLAMLLSFDMKKLYDWLEPMMGSFFEMVPEESRPRMQALWQKAVGLSEYMGDHHAIAYDFSPEGIRAITVSETSDADKFMAAYDEMLSGPDYAELMATMGVEVAVLPRTEVAGAEVRHFQMSFDAEKMMRMNPAAADMPPEAREMMQGMFDRLLGKDGLVSHVANVAGKLVVVVGDDRLLSTTIQQVAGGGAPQGAMAEALTVAGGNPSFLLRMELRSLLGGLFGMVREMMPPEMAEDIPTMPEGGPIPMLMYASVDGRHAMGGYVMDAEPLADLVGYFMSMAERGMEPAMQPDVAVPGGR